MKRIHWSTLNDTEIEADGNQVKIKGENEAELEVRVVDKNGNKIKRYLDIKLGEHKVLITMKFQWGVVNYADTSANEIEYIFKKADDCWEIDRDERNITVKKRDEFEKAKKQAHKNLLKQKFGSDIDNKQDMAKTEDMKYTILEDGKGDYKVNIYRGDTSEDRQFSWEQVEIKPQYGLVKQVDFDILHNVKYQDEMKESHNGNGWIFFIIIFLVIITSVIIFRKKLWRWIKGERKQEKKVREQIDIF